MLYEFLPDEIRFVPIHKAPDTMLNALTLCNSCEYQEANPRSRAGLCDECRASIRPLVGHVLTYAVHGGEHRRVCITGVEDDIKNGKPGFDGVTGNGLTVWGYDYQIVRYHFPI